MILYFSGTGNTKLLAERLSKELLDEARSLDEGLLSDGLALFSEKPYVIMSPIHAWGLPQKVEELLLSSDLSGCQEVYFLLTMGANHGGMESRLLNMSRAMGLTYKGLYPFLMPNNYFMGEALQDEDEQVSIIKSAYKELDEVANRISLHQSLVGVEDRRGGALLRLFAPLIHKMYCKYGQRGYKFSVSDECIRCGRCVENCPTHNIKLQDGKITFGKQCMTCLRCVSVCPAQAIDVNGKAGKNGILHLDRLIAKL